MTVLFRASRILPLRLILVAVVLLAGRTALGAPPQPAAGQSQTEPDRSSAYYHYGLAHLYEEMAVNAGRPDYSTQAVEEYKLALDADPNSVMLQDGLAALYFKIGRYKEAVSAAEEQVKRDPNDVEAHMLLGQFYVRSLGDMQGPQAADMLQHAIAEYETIARLKPNDIETKLLLGGLYAYNHDSAKAEAEFKEAQKIDANSEEVVLNMARLYSEEGDPQRAVDTLSAVPIDDRTPRMELYLGESLGQLKKWKEAAAAYRRSLDIDPDNPDAERGLANALLEDDQLDEALKALNALVAADPSDAQSQIHIAEIERSQGRYDDALASLQKVKSLTQDSPELNYDVNYNEALVYDAQGKYDQATKILMDLVDATSHPEGKYSDPEKQNRYLFLNRLGIIYREENKTAEAEAVYKQIVALGGDYADSGYGGEIDSYRDGHQWKDALAAAAEAAKAAPKDHSVQLMYASQLTDMGQVDEGIALAKAQLSGGADDREVEESLAGIYVRLKRFKEADEAIGKAEALATKPNEKFAVLFLRGDYYDRQKMYDRAEVEFRKALTIDPQDPGVLNYLGYMLADEGQKLPDALKMIRRAVELEPQKGEYLDSLGWVYFKMGQYAQAEENLRKANERINTDPTIHDHLGEVYEKTGDLKMAVAQWERSMTEYAHSLPADADPEEVQKVQHKLENARVKLAKLNTSAVKGVK
jgi:tetratricopeptide (TPR) repeat protein